MPTFKRRSFRQNQALFLGEDYAAEQIDFFIGAATSRSNSQENEAFAGHLTHDAFLFIYRTC